MNRSVARTNSRGKTVVPIEEKMFVEQDPRMNDGLRRGRRPEQEKQQNGSILKEKYKHHQNENERMVRSHLGNSASNGSQRSIKNPAIWKKLEEAKKKQDSIRNRVRKYSQNDDDSDYGDSMSFSEKNSFFMMDDHDGNENDSDEYDEEFDLEVPTERNEVVQKSKGPPEQYSALPQTRPKIVRKNSFKEVLRRSFAKRSPTEECDMTPSEVFQRRRSSSMVSLSSQNSSQKSEYPVNINEQIQQRRSSMYSQSSHGTIHNERSVSTNGSFSTEDRRMRALTPEEAIRMVMERHTYISDSESEDEEPTQETSKRRAPPSASASKTTANKTVTQQNDDPQERNHTPTGKRVLSLKQKKQREDTHPRTSNKEGYQQRNQAQHLRTHIPTQKDGNVASAPRVSRSREENSKQQHTPASTTTEIEEDDSGYRSYIQQIDEFVPHDSNGDNYQDQSSTEKHTSSEQKVLASAVATQADTKKKELIVGINSDNDSSSSDDDDEYDDDFLGTDEDIRRKQSSKSKITDEITNPAAETQDDGSIQLDFDDDDDDDEEEEDEEDDNWGHLSFKTAKTSRSAVSRFSKATSVTALWIKNAERNGSGTDADDDILFFDALQEVGESGTNKSVKMSKAPPTVISDDKDDNNKSFTEHTHPTVPVHKDEDDDDEDEDESFGDDDDSDGGGWTGKLTNFVGFTISALAGSGSKDEEDEDEEERSSPPKVPSFRNLTKKNRSPPKNPPKSAVSSRELEIIKKCQEQMKVQQKEIERREREAARNDLQNIELRRKEEAARAIVRREVIAYRQMMEGMGKEDFLAPLDSKEAAQEYDDRLAMGKTLEEQERKMKLNERNMMMMMMDQGDGEQSKSCACTCVIS